MLSQLSKCITLYEDGDFIDLDISYSTLILNLIKILKKSKLIKFNEKNYIENIAKTICDKNFDKIKENDLINLININKITKISLKRKKKQKKIIGKLKIIV